MQLIQKIIYPKKGVSVLERDFIQCHILYKHPPSPILLQQNNDGWPTWWCTHSNDTLFKQLLQLFLHFTFFYKNIHVQPKFDSGESDYSWISCSTSLLGGNPLGSWNTSLSACHKSSIFTFIFCFVVPPSRDNLPLLDSSSYQLFLINNKKNTSC